MRDLSVQASERLDEAMHSAVLDDGLPVVVVQARLPGKSVAIAREDYGAVDQEFVTPPEPRRARADPEGIAHFLEHKLFEDGSGRRVRQVRRKARSANASPRTPSPAYHFATSERFCECLDLLLEFVTDPHFTAREQIEKERHVIAQEIRMYWTTADSRAPPSLLRALYHRHPMREEIPGTVGSIKEIDTRMLEAVPPDVLPPGPHGARRRGDVDPREVITRLEAAAAARRERRGEPAPSTSGPELGPVRVAVDEPSTIVSARADERQSVASPRVLMGWKDAPSRRGRRSCGARSSTGSCSSCSSAARRPSTRRTTRRA